MGEASKPVSLLLTRWFFVFKALNRGKGLLPEPNILQILNSLGNPASLQLLLNPLLHGAVGGKQGKAERGAEAPGLCPRRGRRFLRLLFPPGILGAAPSVPLVTNPALSTALLQLALQNQTQAQQVSRNFADAGFPLRRGRRCRRRRAGVLSILRQTNPLLDQGPARAAADGRGFPKPDGGLVPLPFCAAASPPVSAPAHVPPRLPKLFVCRFEEQRERSKERIKAPCHASRSPRASRTAPRLVFLLSE